MPKKIGDPKSERDWRSQPAIPSAFALGKFANMPTAFRKGSAKIKRNEIVRSLQQVSTHHVRLLQEADHYLTLVIRETLKVDDRLEIAEAIFAETSRAVANAYEFFQKRDVPAALQADKAQGLESAVAVMEKLAICYKQIYDKYRSEGLTRRQQPKVSFCGFRILEVLRDLQLLLGVLYKSLPKTEWHDANVVFFKRFEEKGIDRPYALACDLPVYRSHSKLSAEGEQMASMRQLYVSMAISGFLNVQTWPHHFQHRLIAYFEGLDEELKIASFKGGKLNKSQLVIYEDDAGAPHMNSRATRVKALCVEMGGVAERVAADMDLLKKMQLLGETKSKALLRPLKDIPHEDRIPFVKLFLNSLEPKQRRENRKAIFGGKTAKLFVGFKDSYKLYLDLMTKSGEELEKKREFVDGLAAYSAQLASDEHERGLQAWEVQDESEGGVMVSTLDSAGVFVPELNSLVSFALDDAVKDARIGYIARVGRSLDRRVNIGIATIGNKVEVALVQGVDDLGERQGLPALLLQSPQGRWLIVLRKQYGFIPGTPLMLLRSNRGHLPARLGEAFRETADYATHEISGPKLKQ